ncbi:MAG: transketolase family protein [Bacteroidia bacterium]|nr:transketolase family protein [Bacteroidia bacterium]
MSDEYRDTGAKDTRSGFGAALLELGRKNERVVALCADLTASVKMDAFKAEFPERFFQCGVAEANMMGVAAGLALSGFIPFAGTFANFAAGRSYDQIRQSICYTGANVKIAASHAGLTLGEDGATHQILEDVGMMRMLPGMTVVVPCDYNQTRLATLALAERPGPAYLRFGRPPVPNFTPFDDPNFQIGKAQILRRGDDLVIFANGHMVRAALEAARILASEGRNASVVNIHTVKPLDVNGILDAAKNARRVVVVEEHQRFGGLGELVAAVLAQNDPMPVRIVAVEDKFGESGTPEALLVKYGLTPEKICEAAQKFF